MSTPFRNKPFTFTQPDGSKLQVRGTGDQYYAVFETLDGFTVVKNPNTGYFEIARLSADGTSLEPAGVAPGNVAAARATVAPGVRVGPEAARARGLEGVRRMGGRRCDQRREQRKNLTRMARAMNGAIFAPPQRHTVGDFVGLCLLIDFSDEPGAIPPEEVADFCNKPGYTGFGNNGSVSDYFRDNSIGRCRYTNIVTPYYRARNPKSYYTNPNIEQGVRARELIVEALTHWKAANFDFSGLTADSGGYVYAMNVYYAGEVENNWAEGLWPHAWSLATRFPLVPGKWAFDYQFTDMSQQLTLGTFCHENGHMLCDYPDLYDYGYESSGVGAYCLMCAGGNANERNPTHISAYLKRMSGWANSVTPIRHDARVTLAAGTNDFAMLAKSDGEYFLLENRARSARDSFLTDEGLAIWHVDEDGNNSNEQRTPSSHYELSLVQADGQFHLETTRNHLGDAADLFGRTVKRFADGTTPASRWWDGTSSNLEIYEISAPGPSMTFRIRLSEESGGIAEPLRRESAPRAAIPDNTAAGISDTIAFDQEATIAGVKVSLDITHTYIGDLQVTLLTPWGASILLHPRHQGGSADNIRRTYADSELPALADLRGRSVNGLWRLTVQDLAPADTGTLNKWGLEFITTGPPQDKIVLEESPGTHIPDNNRTGIERTLTAPAGTVGRVEVSVDISHPYVGDLRVSLRSPAGTEVVLHDRAGGSADNIAATYTPATISELAALSGEPAAGEWRLHVSDRAGRDLGTLNRWRLVIHPPA